MIFILHDNQIQKMSQEEVEDELVLRLVYEFIFDIISLDSIIQKKWMDSSLRDKGHHNRMCLLVKYCKNIQKYSWLKKI